MRHLRSQRTPAPTTSLNVMVDVSQTGNFISGSLGFNLVTIGTSGTATLTVATDNDNTDEPNGSITAQVQDRSRLHSRLPFLSNRHCQ